MACTLKVVIVHVVACTATATVPVSTEVARTLLGRGQSADLPAPHEGEAKEPLPLTCEDNAAVDLLADLSLLQVGIHLSPVAVVAEAPRNALEPTSTNITYAKMATRIGAVSMTTPMMNESILATIGQRWAVSAQRLRLAKSLAVQMLLSQQARDWLLYMRIALILVIIWFIFRVLWHRSKEDSGAATRLLEPQQRQQLRPPGRMKMSDELMLEPQRFENVESQPSPKRYDTHGPHTSWEGDAHLVDLEHRICPAFILTSEASWWACVCEQK